MNERMNEWTNEWTNERVNERMNERTNEWMNERTNEWMNYYKALTMPTHENRRTSRYPVPRTNLSTTDLTRTGLGSNLGLHGDRPATDRLTHGNDWHKLSLFIFLCTKAFKTYYVACSKYLKCRQFSVEQLYKCAGSWYTVLRRQPTYLTKVNMNFVKYVGCLRDTVYQAAVHSHSYCTKRCQHVNCLALVHSSNCVQKWLIWFHAVLFWFGSLMMISCGSKHVGIFSLIL
jgi:hypothetical protein